MCLDIFKKRHKTQSLDDYIEFVRSEVGEIERYEIDLETIKAELKALNMIPMFTRIPEFKQFYVNEETLIRIVPYLTYSAEYYVSSLEIDCDDYAMWGAADARRILIVAFGDRPRSRSQHRRRTVRVGEALAEIHC